jgi:hypothetical protein
MMEEINEVFSDKHRLSKDGSVPTSSSLQATPENKKGSKGNNFFSITRVRQVNPFNRDI